ncbi:MAG: hypothetical protein V3S03_08480 [Vicinamibacteria bacterium]
MSRAEARYLYRRRVDADVFEKLRAIRDELGPRPLAVDVLQAYRTRHPALVALHISEVSRALVELAESKLQTNHPPERTHPNEGRETDHAR